MKPKCVLSILCLLLALICKGQAVNMSHDDLPGKWQVGVFYNDSCIFIQDENGFCSAPAVYTFMAKGSFSLYCDHGCGYTTNDEGEWTFDKTSQQLTMTYTKKESDLSDFGPFVCTIIKATESTMVFSYLAKDEQTIMMCALKKLIEP